MRTTVSSKGQIVLPVDLRRRDGIEAGDELALQRLGAGRYRLQRVSPRPNAGVVAWLRSCPDPGFFTPISSESTDSL